MRLERASVFGSPVVLFFASGVACTAGSGNAADPGPGSGSGGGGLEIGGPAPPGCGNGELTDDEACDDGNTDGGDGCFANCLGIDPGFICPFPGELCSPFARCGDGLVSFPEQCDDGGEEPGDGCSSSCKLELGYKCSVEEGAPSSCTPTTCGDGIIEGAETCDNGPDVVGDGCSSRCIGEPDCSQGPCVSSCGDGLVLGQECDDGNLIDGDGCSANCEIEAGYECTQTTDCPKDASGSCALVVPAVYRDFSQEHPDFESCDDKTPTVGLVGATLENGKPVQVGAKTCTAHIDEWYVDSAQSTTHVGDIILYDNGKGGFVNRWGDAGEQWVRYEDYGQFDGDHPPYTECKDSGCVPCEWDLSKGCSATATLMDGDPLFFPVDGIADAKDDGGFEAQVSTLYWNQYRYEEYLFGVAVPHNFHFTSEVTYWFTYEVTTNATLDFTGDDDLWVFVNGHLAVDLGGVHEAATGSVTIDSSSAADFDLSPGNVYEIKIFHAERRTTASQYRLTLEGFSAARSDCQAICGDGVIGFGEQCDDGENDGGYNECQPGCVLGTYCGNGIVDEGEDCDDADPAAPGTCAGCRILVVR